MLFKGFVNKIVRFALLMCIAGSGYAGAVNTIKEITNEKKTKYKLEEDEVLVDLNKVLKKSMRNGFDKMVFNSQGKINITPLRNYFADEVLDGEHDVKNIKDGLMATIKYNPEIKIAMAKVRVAYERYVAKYLSLYPNIKGVVRAPLDSKTNFDGKDLPLSMRGQAGVEMRLNIFNGWSDVCEINAAYYSYQAALCEYMAAVQKAMEDYLKAHVELWVCTSKFIMYAIFLHSMEEDLTIVKKRFELGVADITQTKQAESNHAQSITNLIKNFNQLQVARSNYRKICGLLPSMKHLDLFSLKVKFRKNINKMYEKAQQHNPKILSLNYSIQAAQEQARNYSEILPDVNLTGSLLYNGSYDFKRRQDGFGAGPLDMRLSLDVNVPLVNLSAGAKIRESRAKYMENMFSLENNLRDLFASLAQGAQNMNSLGQTLTEYIDAVKRAEQLVDSMTSQLALGTKNTTDLTQVLQDMTRAVESFIDAVREYFFSGIQILVSLGDLTPELFDIDYNPMEEFEKSYSENKKMFRYKDADPETIKKISNPEFADDSAVGKRLGTLIKVH